MFRRLQAPAVLKNELEKKEMCQILIPKMVEALCYKPEGRGFDTR
jgi:hypothetical protein